MPALLLWDHTIRASCSRSLRLASFLGICRWIYCREESKDRSILRYTSLLYIKGYGIPGVQFGSFRGWKRWVRKGLLVLRPWGDDHNERMRGFSSASAFSPEASIEIVSCIHTNTCMIGSHST